MTREVADDTARAWRDLVIRAEIAVMFQRLTGWEDVEAITEEWARRQYAAQREADRAYQARRPREVRERARAAKRAEKTQGLSPRPNGRPKGGAKVDVAEAARLRAEGLSYKAIGIVFGVSAKSALKAVRRAEEAA